MSSSPKQRRQRKIPTPTQRVILLRHFTQVLQDPLFVDTLKQFRESWEMKPVEVGSPGWALPQQHDKEFKETRAIEQFANYWFRGLGGMYLASRLIYWSDWEGRPVHKVIFELARAIENASRLDPPAYAIGEMPFQPSKVWKEPELAADLATSEWQVEPAPDDGSTGPRVTRNARMFIECYPWSSQEDVVQAFLHSERLRVRAVLPGKVRGAQSLLTTGLKAYRRYCSTRKLQVLDHMELYRRAERFARAIGLPRPQRPRRRTKSQNLLTSAHARSNGQGISANGRQGHREKRKSRKPALSAASGSLKDTR